ncbi:MAG: hypothetical protein HYU51_13695 [Candidatus Rokubacteria bacterium]|nr:hypothetical protein [Candidatus Rokubacteria bacterium]
MHQNITLRLEKRLIRKAKIRAAERGTSISGLLAEYLQEKLEDEDAYEQARQRALDLLDRGFHLGGHVPASRDELHER